jgi:hypothetical protein
MSAPLPFRHLQNYIGPDERRAVLAEIETRSAHARRVNGRGGIGPRYAVLGGDEVVSSLPLVAAIGARVRAVVGEFAAAPVEPFHDPVRRVRVQIYTEPEDGFRWHFDGHQYVALVTLENGSDGVTELIAPRTSTLVRPFFYPAYAFPQIFSVLPRTSVTMEAGDALVFSGSRSLHRGRSRTAGRRTVLVYAFDVEGTKRSGARNWIARRLNY